MRDMTRQDKVEADIDMRMLAFLEFFEDFEDEIDRTRAIRIARAAYYAGYYDAYTEARPYSLFLDNGYGLPIGTRA
jgi:hypothetical protein